MDATCANSEGTSCFVNLDEVAPLVDATEMISGGRRRGGSVDRMAVVSSKESGRDWSVGCIWTVSSIPL